MVANNQQASLARVLAHEGGSVDDRRDPGGRTSKGVTQRVYDAWRRGNSQPRRDVFRIAMSEVRAIYTEQYWNRVRADTLPCGLDYAVFDAAVNSGPVQAVKWLQRALGGIAVDGVVGQVTLGAVRAHTDIPALIAAMCARRMAFLKQLRTWKHFGDGWTRRVSDVESTAVAMASGVKRTGRATGKAVTKGAPPGLDLGAARAELSHIRKVRGVGVAQAMAGAGLATAAAAEALGEALRHAAEEIGVAGQDLPGFTTVATWLAATGVLLLAGGVGWRLYLGWRQGKLADAIDGDPVRDANFVPQHWLHPS